MTEFEKRHLNGFETLVEVLLTVIIYGIAVAFGSLCVAIPNRKESGLFMLIFIIGVVVLIVSTIVFIGFIIHIALEYYNTKDPLPKPKENK